MKRLRKYTACLLLSFLLFPFEIKDALGRVHHFNTVPSKVISLSPAITETMVILGLKGKIAGRTSFSNLPGVPNIKDVGGIINPNIEIIKSLKPSLVFVMQPSSINLINSIQRSGIEVFAFSEPKNLEGIGNMLLVLGRMFNKERMAEKIRRKFLREITPLKEKKGKVYIGFVKAPFWAACRGTFLDDLIKRAGWKNICREDGWTSLSGEKIFTSSPEAIILPSNSWKKVSPFLREFPWKDTPAVKKGKVLILPENRLLRPSPLIVQVYKIIKDFR